MRGVGWEGHFFHSFLYTLGPSLALSYEYSTSCHPLLPFLKFNIQKGRSYSPGKKKKKGEGKVKQKKKAKTIQKVRPRGLFFFYLYLYLYTR